MSLSMGHLSNVLDKETILFVIDKKSNFSIFTKFIIENLITLNELACGEPQILQKEGSSSVWFSL